MTYSATLFILSLVALVAANEWCPNNRPGVIGQPCQVNEQRGFCSSDCWNRDSSNFVAKSGCCDYLSSQYKCCINPPAPDDAPGADVVCTPPQVVGISGECEDPVSESTDSCPSGQVSDGQGGCITEQVAHVPVTKSATTCPNRSQRYQPCVGNGILGTCTTSCVGANHVGVARTGCCDGLSSAWTCCVDTTATNSGETTDGGGSGDDNNTDEKVLCPTTDRVVLRTGPCKTTSSKGLMNSGERFDLLSDAAGVESACGDGYRWLRLRRQSDGMEGYMTTSLTSVECAPPSNNALPSNCQSLGSFNLPAGTASGTRSLWATTYRISHKAPASSGQSLREYPSGRAVATLSTKDYCDCHLQGTCVVDGVGVMTFARTTSQYPKVQCSHGRQTAILFSKTKAPFGIGGGSYRSIDGQKQPVYIAPYRTLATDRSVIPQGRFVYIPAARGVSFTHNGETAVHDGWYFAGDTGSAIRGNHIDHFSGFTTSNTPMPFIKSRSSGTFTAYVHTNPPQVVRDYLLKLHDPRFRCGGAALLNDNALVGGDAENVLAVDDPDQAEPTPASSEGLPAYAIVIIVLAVVLLVAAVAVAVVMTRTRGAGSANSYNTVAPQESAPAATAAAYQCAVCGKDYDNADDLSAHVELRHA